MKKLALFVLSVPLAWMPFPASAFDVDMSTVTCAELFASDDDEATAYLFWLDGWLAGQANDTTFDEELLYDQIIGIAEVCADNPNLSVMNAAEEYLVD